MFASRVSVDVLLVQICKQVQFEWKVCLVSLLQQIHFLLIFSPPSGSLPPSEPREATGQNAKTHAPGGGPRPCADLVGAGHRSGHGGHCAGQSHGEPSGGALGQGVEFWGVYFSWGAPATVLVSFLD